MIDLVLAVVVSVTTPSSDSAAAIPAAQLIGAAQKAYAELQRIADLAGPDTGLDSLTAQVANMEREVDQLRSAWSAMPTTAPDDQADGRGQKLGRMKASVQVWADPLSSRVEQLDAAARSVRRLIETWRLTADSPVEETPPALVVRAKDVRDRAIEAERVVRKRLAAALELLDRVVALKLALSAQAANLAAAEAARREELFAIESAPLWRITAWTRAARFPSPIRVLAIQVRGAFAYGASEPMRWVVHLALAAGLIAIGLAVTGRLRRASPAVPSRSVEEATARKYPVDSGILIAIFATPLIHPFRPPALVLLLMVPALVPVLRITSALAPKLRRSVQWLAALLIADSLVAFAPLGALYARLTLLVVASAASIGLVAGLRRRSWSSRLDPSRWTIAVVASAAVASILFAISAVANLVGNVSLAKLLVEGTLGSMFVASAAAAFVAVASGAIRALFELPWSRRFRLVRDYEEPLMRRLDILLRLAAVAVWFLFTLRTLDALQPFRAAVEGLLRSHIKVGALDISAGDVVAFGITLWIAVWISRALKFVLEEAVFPPLEISRGGAAAISTTVKYAVVGIGFGAALLAARVEITRFTVLAGTLGIGIGFGLQNVVNNFVSGLILLYEQPVQVGDIIELEQLSGEVRRIGVRSSTVRTFQGAEVVVPNSTFISAQVTNWTRSDRWRRVDITLGVAYGTDPSRVVELLLGIAKDCAAVAATPEPTALFTGFGDSALQFELRVWTMIDNWVATASSLRASIHEILSRAGVVLAFPQLDVWVRSIPGEAERTRRP